MLKINYKKYRSFSEQYKKQMTQMKEVIDSFSELLTDLFTNGVISGNIHEELRIYQGYVMQASEMISDIDMTMNKLIEIYLQKLNAAQCIEGKYILYAEEYSKLRDYTEENFQSMERLCDSTNHDANVFEQINDWGEDIVANVFSFLGKTFDWFNVRQTQMLVMEVNDITKRQLREIKQSLYYQEDKYAKQGEKLLETIGTLNEYLLMLQEIISWKNGEFNASGFKQKMTDLYDKMVGQLKEVNISSVVMAEHIRKFLELVYPERFFNQSEDLIYDYLQKLSEIKITDPEFWGMVVTQQFDMAIQRIKEEFTDYDYTDYLMDKEMLDLLDEMADRESLYEGTDLEKSKSYIETFMSYVEKYGDKWEEYLEGVRDQDGKLILDKRTNEYKAFKAFFKQFGNAKEILSYGGDLCSIIAKYVADYEKCKQILEVLEAQCTGNAEMAESLARIRKIYERSWDAIAKDVFDKVTEYGVEYLEKYAGEALKTSVFKIVGWVELGIDIGGEITGITDDSVARLQLLALGYDQMNSAKAAYEQALLALQNCDPNSAEYEKCMKEFEHCFEYYRVTQKRLFEKMGEASNGVEGEYYRYCARRMEELSLTNFEDFHLMTFEEYKAL